ncbi:MAG: hypothetical protein Q8Q78_18800 [Hydrogenophaga sp.]|nr:hypothetical protein [Hydrogenophaga sp.]
MNQRLDSDTVVHLIDSSNQALECTLVNNDVREFQRVPGLKVEDWL